MNHGGGPPADRAARPHQDWILPVQYEIRQLIGTGSYGHVCEAHDRENRIPVAIKRIHRVFEDLVDCKRILREIAILNRLNHRNVVRVLNICVPQDLLHFDELYLVLEIADSDFKKLFRTNVYLTEEHIVLLLYNLLLGLKYIHSVGIYHRDLKPANCLVNQDCDVKICDFGLARTVDQNRAVAPAMPHANANQRQLTGHVVTRWYRAPELILLQENYTEAIDVWSCGCIFAELLAMMRQNVHNYSRRQPLFPGTFCFPLSPDHNNVARQVNFRNNRDQLDTIFSVLGTPSDEDIEAFDREDARRYIRIFQPRQGINFSQRFPGASVDAVDLLQRMLVFNPRRRITVDQCLEHPLFRSMRDPTREALATGSERLRLPFNDWQPMDEHYLRYYFILEIQRFHPRVQVPESLMQIIRERERTQQQQQWAAT